MFNDFYSNWKIEKKKTPIVGGSGTESDTPISSSDSYGARGLNVESFGDKVTENNRNVQENGGSFSLAEREERDKEYMDAVKSGDRDAQQKLVKAAASAAMPETKVVDENGMPKVVYHGSPQKGITAFDKERVGEHTYAYGDKAIYATDDAEVADVFSRQFLPGSLDSTVKLGEKGEVYPVYLNMRKPFDLRDVENSEEMQNILKSMPDIGDGPSFESMMNGIKYGNHQYIKTFIDMGKLEELGYDGIIARMYTYEEGKDALEYGVFNPDQIKSAEPVTYDDNDRAIPLSKRFDETTDDIRFSLRDKRRRFGGNSGYVGYSKSKRAVEAEERGLRNKSQMDKDFADEVNGLIKAALPEATNVSLAKIKNSLKNMRADEWHHTSMYGNETDYYSAETVADYFVDRLSGPRKAKTDAVNDAMKATGFEIDINDRPSDSVTYTGYRKRDGAFAYGEISKEEYDAMTPEQVAERIKSGTIEGGEGHFSLSEREDDGLKDILTNGELNLDERMTEAALKLSNEHKDDRSLRINAMRAIGGNLTKLRQAMSLQRFGRPTK